MAENNSSSAGIGVGSVIAFLLSWFKWHSLLYAILHGLVGWLYVIYYLIVYGWPK